MKNLLPIFIICGICMGALANNIQISNIVVTNNVAAPTTKLIQFDVSWDNSWRMASGAAPGNWDGAWVFFKFKDNDGNWYPIRFTGAQITAPAGAAYEVGNNTTIPGIGMFIFRAAAGSGTATVTAFKAGIESYPGTYEVRGFAIEMVHIPTGSYSLGDGISFNTFKDSNASPNPYIVQAGGITMGTGAGQLYDPEGQYSGTLPNFPKGYQAFWMMKYELSLGGYRDFLNTISPMQQEGRLPSAMSISDPAGTLIDGDYLEIVTPGNTATNIAAVFGLDLDNDNIYNEATDGEWNAMENVSYVDAAAYLDWAGLRLMTELEYEKACRGPMAPVGREFAWGTAGITSMDYIYNNRNAANETVSNASSILGNAIWGASRGGTKTHRVGMFATALSNRVSAGASYYGVLDLTGSGEEWCVTIQNVAGRSYGGKHGDGELSSVGNANENYWPGVNGTTGTTASPGEYYPGAPGVRSDGGMMQKGGGWASTISTDITVSHREDAGYSQNGAITGVPFSNTSASVRGVRDSNL